MLVRSSQMHFEDLFQIARYAMQASVQRCNMAAAVPSLPLPRAGAVVAGLSHVRGLGRQDPTWLGPHGTCTAMFPDLPGFPDPMAQSLYPPVPDSTASPDNTWAHRVGEVGEVGERSRMDTTWGPHHGAQ
jgi:hypothetical protein